MMTEDANKDDNNTPQPLEQSVEVVGTAEAAVDDKLKKLTQLVYILQAISLAVGLTAIAGLILNYLKRDEVKGTYLEDHFRWQIKTFWYALVGVILGWLLVIVLVGFLIWAVVGLWYIYRIVKGWLALNDGKSP
jgi:uncharacterized membrane protein